MAVSFRGLNVSCTLHVNTLIWPQHFLYQAPFLSLPLLLQTMMAVFQETLWKGQLVLVALIIKAEQFLLLGSVAPPVNLPESLTWFPAVMYLFTFLQKRRHWGINLQLVPLPGLSAPHAEAALTTGATAASPGGSQAREDVTAKELAVSWMWKQPARLALLPSASIWGQVAAVYIAVKEN